MKNDLSSMTLLLSFSDHRLVFNDDLVPSDKFHTRYAKMETLYKWMNYIYPYEGITVINCDLFAH